MPARGRRAPQGDPVGIDAVERPGAGDRGAPVVELCLGVDHLTGLAVARSEEAIVEDERRDADGGEALRVRVKPLLADAVEAVPDDDARRRRGTGRTIVPGATADVLRLESDVVSHGARLIEVVKRS